MSDVLNRAATALVAEHLADSIAATSGKDGTGLLAITSVSRPILVAALRHFTECLRLDAVESTGAEGGMGEVTYGPGEAEAKAGALVTRYLTTSAEVAAVVEAARAEGARRERKRILGLKRDEELGALLRAAAAATINGSPSVLSWSALLAAITEANTEGE